MSPATPKQPVSIFNQAAEDRLKELLGKRKGDKLTDDEALQVRQLRLLKDKARQAKEGAAIEQARRRLADRDKYRLGGFALAAGLKGWSDADLQAGFVFLAAMDAARRAALPPAAANADTQAGGDDAAAPAMSTTASMPAPTPEAKEATHAQAQAEPMAEAATAMTTPMPAPAPMPHEPPPKRKLGRLM